MKQVFYAMELELYLITQPY